LFAILRDHQGWNEGRFAKQAGVALSVLSNQLSGQRPIRIQHLSAYLRVLDAHERPKLLNAWLRDNVEHETIHDLLNGQIGLNAEVREWRPELNPDQAAMLDWLAQELPNDPELEKVFTHLTKSVGFRFPGMGEKFTGSPLRLREFIERAPAFIWLDGADGKGCSFVNKRWLRFTGSKLKNELGDGWAKHIHPKDRQRIVHSYKKACERRQPLINVYRLKRHDGKYRWIVSQGTPRYDGRKFVGYIGCAMDITGVLPAQTRFHFPPNK